MVRRHGDTHSWLFVLNHTEHPVEVPATGHELIQEADCSGTIAVPAGGVAVVRERGS
ncbi:MAG TPA: Beta-galactosidase C-terminal domain [Jiangellaceae bacterium]|nr:Beta-galactosidase C-terminal domain [Jiangellaceae bacterium]